MTRSARAGQSYGFASICGGAALVTSLSIGVDAFPAELPGEVRCITDFEYHGHSLTKLSEKWDAAVASGGGGGYRVAHQTCQDFQGCETAAFLVKLQLGENYLDRLETSYWLIFASGLEPMLGSDIRSRVRAAFAVWKKPRVVCLPEACTTFGDTPLMRAVLGKLVFHHEHTLELLPPPAAGEVVVLSRLVNQAHLGSSHPASGRTLQDDVPRGRRHRHSTDTVDQGLCVCTEAPMWAEMTGNMWNSLSIRFARAPVTAMLAATDMGGKSERQVLKRFMQCPKKLYSGALTFTVSMKIIEAALDPNTDEGACIPGLLNSALLCALAAKSVHSESPGVFLAKLETVLHLALLARSCPGRMIQPYVGTCGVAPPIAFGVQGVLRQYQIALSGFARGHKHLGHSSLWRDPAEFDTSCNHAAVEADFLRLAGASGEPTALPDEKVVPSATLSLPRDARGARVMCLFPASHPSDNSRIEQVARTFASRCTSAKFFVSSSKDGPPTWNLAPELGEYEVLNLASIFDHPLMTEDTATFMKTGAQGWASKQKVFRGNLIMKVMAMLMVTADLFIQNADFFCRLDLDTVFIPENLQAFVRAMGVTADDRVYLGVQNYFWKYTHGVFPDGGAGICLTRGALTALAEVLRNTRARFSKEQDKSNAGFWMRRFADQPFDKCEFQEGHFDDLVLGQCLRVANVTAHPALEDRLGRAYATGFPMPCWEHMQNYPELTKLAERPPRWRSRRRQLLRVMFDRAEDGELHPSSWAHQMHRYVPCEPSASDWSVSPSYWLSPFAFSFHDYKKLELQQHAYDVIYCGASCNWTFGYRLHVFKTGEVTGCGPGTLAAAK